MEQSEPPTDSFMELARPLTIPRFSPPPGGLAVRQTMSPVRHLDSLGFLQFVSGDTDFDLVLGRYYVFRDLFNLHHQATLALYASDPAHRFVLPGEDDPDTEALIRLLVMSPADRRMTYRWLLECEIRSAEPDRQRILFMERAIWQQVDTLEISTKLDAGLEWPLDTLMREPQACWIWKRKVQPNRPVPTTSSWRGMKYVSVHRLLWPIARPDEPFTLGRRPVRNTQLCQDKRCVNPRHFIDPSRRLQQHIQGPGKGYKGAIRSPSHIKWNIENIENIGGRRELHCPRCGALAGGRLQEMVNWPEGVRPTEGEMFCSNCNRIYKEHLRMFTTPRSMRMPDEAGLETQAERWERMGEAAQEQQERRDRGLRFDWDNDWSDGTSTKDKPADPA